jgi:hypothetical protein
VAPPGAAWGFAVGEEIRNAYNPPVTAAGTPSVRAAPPIRDLVVGAGTGPADRVVARLWSVRTGGGRFLVPAGSRRAAASSLRSFNRLRPRRVRGRRAVLGTLAAAGATRLVARPVEVRAPRDAPRLLDHLAAVLGEPDLVFATTEQAGRGFQTPMLQLFSPAGRPVGFAKLGWDDVTAGLVDTEAAALALVATARPATFRSPAVLWHGRWEGLAVLVTAPMPAAARRLPASGLPPFEPLHEVATLDGLLRARTVTDSAWWHAARATAAATVALGDPTLEQAVAATETAVAGADLTFGRWHGDWVEWNLATADGELYAWDWAYSAPDVPFGFDVLQFFFLRHRNVDGAPDAVALDRAAVDAAPALARLGLDDDARRVLAAVHRLEFPLRFARAALRRAAAATAAPGDPPAPR